MPPVKNRPAVNRNHVPVPQHLLRTRNPVHHLFIHGGAERGWIAKVAEEGRHSPGGANLPLSDRVKLRRRDPRPDRLLEHRKGARHDLPGRVHAADLLGRLDLNRRFFPQPHVPYLRLQRYPPHRVPATGGDPQPTYGCSADSARAVTSSTGPVASIPTRIPSSA